MAGVKRKLNVLSIEQKMKILNAALENSDMKKNQIAQNFGIPPTTLSTILKNREKIVLNFEGNRGYRKRIKKCGYPEIEEHLFEWYNNCRESNVFITGIMVKEAADELSKKLGYPDFKASNKWLENFKKRHHISFRRTPVKELNEDLDAPCTDTEKLLDVKVKEENDSSSKIDRSIFENVGAILPRGTFSFEHPPGTSSPPKYKSASQPAVPSALVDGSPAIEILPSIAEIPGVSPTASPAAHSSQPNEDRPSTPVASSTSVDSCRSTLHGGQAMEKEFDLFGRRLIQQLKNMPLERALVCMEKLQSVLVEERLIQMMNAA